MMKFTDMEIMEITGFGLITNSILNVSCFRFYYLGGDTEKKMDIHVQAEEKDQRLEMLVYFVFEVMEIEENYFLPRQQKSILKEHKLK